MKNNESKNTPQYHVRQINDGNFQRSFYLPEDIAVDKINARFENGILNIEIPKDEPPNTKLEVFEVLKFAGIPAIAAPFRVSVLLPTTH